jgi:redox-sensitive bicupin YhaK (pirin superfamily)
MLPDGFDWLKDGGLSRKSLGHFTEDDVTVEMIRWDGTGDPALQCAATRTSLTFVLKGSVTVNGATHGAQTAIWSDFGESHELTGDVGTEAIVIGLPLERPGN